MFRLRATNSPCAHCHQFESGVVRHLSYFGCSPATGAGFPWHVVPAIQYPVTRRTANAQQYGRNRHASLAGSLDRSLSHMEQVRDLIRRELHRTPPQHYRHIPQSCVPLRTQLGKEQLRRPLMATSTICFAVQQLPV